MTTRYSFTVANTTVATINEKGNFILKDDSGSIEKFDNVAAFLESMGMKPAGNVEECVKQVATMLGEECKVTGVTGDTEMKQATKATPAAKAAKPAAKQAAKPTTKSAKPAAETHKDAPLSKCLCGCGSNTKSKFAPGHDARVHGWFKKVIAGTMKKNELRSELLPLFKEYEVKHG